MKKTRASTSPVSLFSGMNPVVTLYHWVVPLWIADPIAGTDAFATPLNQDLWQQLDGLNHPQVHWEYTRGHAGEEGNERCDEIAQAFSKGAPPQLVDQT